ncbi:hypothetical protein K7G98_04040 [Saccharothrix sp. MB29]|nr:hypothetical protein [Saccharothrix sp. MB29]
MPGVRRDGVHVDVAVGIDVHDRADGAVLSLDRDAGVARQVLALEERLVVAQPDGLLVPGLRGRLRLLTCGSMSWRPRCAWSSFARSPVGW